MPQDRTPQLSFNLSRRLISIFLVSVLAVYTAGITVTLRLRRSAMQDWQAAYTAQAADFTDQLNTELLRIRTQMKYTLTRSVTLRLTLTPRQASFPALYDSILRMTEQVYTMQNTSSLIQSTTAYFPSLNKTIHSSGTYNDPTALEQQLIEAYYAAPGHSAVLTVGRRLYLVSDATSFNNKTSTALVWAELSTAALTRLCSQYAENGQTTAIYCTDGSNIFTVRSPGSASAPAALVVDIQDAVLNEFTGSTETKVDAAEYLRIVQPVGSWSLWTASYAGTDALREVTASFAVWIGVQTIIMLLAVGIFLFLVWRLITKPFRQIAKQLQTMEQTGMLLPDPNGGPAISNDMDFLHYAFAQLGSQLQATLEQAYHNKELAYQSEIKYLQAQINPHFLYNSFYHLYRMAKMEDTDGIAEMSLKLSSYYRYITRSAQPVVTLAMEYQNIVDYTEIQTIRFGDRITVQLQPLPEPYRELAVPRFILQPLFENAYNHGVEKMENGLIQLRFKMEPEFLNIYVENNGSCPDAELEKLTQYLNSTDRKAECTALKNVKLRIPAALDPTEGVAGLYYRSDWLDALGLSEPTNVQEMNDMLVKFAEYGPTVNGGKDTAGLGSTSGVLNTNFALAAYFQAYGAYPNKWIMRDGELVNGIVQDEMVDALNGLKDLYDRGALAPDFATWNSDQFTERVTSDQVGATFGTYYIPAWPLNQNKDANPDADWKEINLPNLGGNAKPAMNQASIQFFNVVTKNAPEHAEEALVKLINLGMAVNENCATDKTIFNGLDKAENGASVFYLPVYIYFPVPWATYRPEIWAAYEAKDRDSLKVEYEKVMYDYMDDWLTNGNNSENRGTSWGQYKSRLEKGMGIDIGLTARETGFYETNYFYGGATATEQRASSTLSDTATSFIIEYIMGQKTEADWESFKQSWNDMGGADWTKEVNEQYKSIAG